MITPRTCRNCGIKTRDYSTMQESLYQNRYFCKNTTSCKYIKEWKAKSIAKQNPLNFEHIATHTRGKLQ